MIVCNKKKSIFAAQNLKRFTIRIIPLWKVRLQSIQIEN